MCSSSGDGYEVLTALGGCGVVVASSLSSHLRGGGDRSLLLIGGGCRVS